MQFRFFSVNATDPGPGADDLNDFLRKARVVGVERQLVGTGSDARWVLCVEYLDGAPAGRSAGARVDYKAVLAPDDFALFARLRELRKAIAEREAIPPYAVFTNEQLAALAQQRPASREAMQAVEGVGAAKVDRYADEFLAAILGPPIP
ncbi:MAG: HRDC domain-containing protein [Deltaproteobacteria bacterium]|nr:HRDC domain-containing protein [Deltaproteobacteria bacterium]